MTIKINKIETTDNRTEGIVATGSNNTNTVSGLNPLLNSLNPEDLHKLVNTTIDGIGSGGGNYGYNTYYPFNDYPSWPQYQPSYLVNYIYPTSSNYRVSESSTQYKVDFIVPGAKAENLELTVTPFTVDLYCKDVSIPFHKGFNFTYGFIRTSLNQFDKFTFLNEVNPNTAEATLTDGILTLTVDKTQNKKKVVVKVVK